jgi:hypothetical protein
MLLEVAQTSAAAPHLGYQSSSAQGADPAAALRRARGIAPAGEAQRLPEAPAAAPVPEAGRSDAARAAREPLSVRILRAGLGDPALPMTTPVDPLAAFQEAVSSDGVPQPFPAERPPVRAPQAADVPEAGGPPTGGAAADAADAAGAPDRAAGAAAPATAGTGAVAEAPLPGEPAPEAPEAGPAGAAQAPAQDEERARQASELEQSVSIVNGGRPRSVLDILA